MIERRISPAGESPLDAPESIKRYQVLLLRELLASGKSYLILDKAGDTGTQSFLLALGHNGVLPGSGTFFIVSWH